MQPNSSHQDFGLRKNGKVNKVNAIGSGLRPFGLLPLSIMNSFGRLLRVSIYGESHGTCVGVVIDGLPAGLKLDESDFLEDLRRRQGGNLAGATPRKEKDIPIFQSGLFNGFTTGAPLNVSFFNENVRSADYEAQRSIPRPGHADFVAHQKFSGFEDYRGGGHFSGRLTVGIVAAGVVAKKLLAGITIQAKLSEDLQKIGQHQGYST